jgi:thiazole/oxazole-forming peptide maturase SagC family component
MTTSTVYESEQEIFYWHFGEQPQLVLDRLNSPRVILLGVNNISHQLAASLHSSGFKNCQVVDYPLLRNLRWFEDGRLKAEEWSSSLEYPVDYQKWVSDAGLHAVDCMVPTCDFGGIQTLREWNSVWLKSKQIFMPVFLQDFVGHIGPIVIPGETACLECLRARWNSNTEDPETQQTLDDAALDGQLVTGFHPLMASTLGQIAAFELVRFYSGLSALSRVGTLIEVNLLATKLNVRKVLKIPRCYACSSLNMTASTTPLKNVFGTAIQPIK